MEPRVGPMAEHDQSDGSEGPEPPGLIPQVRLEEYFHDAVTGAIRNQRIDADAAVCFYLGNLLSEFARYDGDADDPFHEPLALLLSRALQAPPAERVRLLRRLGDVALFVSGFFWQAVELRATGPSYYIGMGGAAYGRLATAFSTRQDGGAYRSLFSELGAKFADFADVLAEVSEHGGSACNRRLVQMYERWLATDSERLARVLAKYGVLPKRPDRGRLKH